VRGLGIFAGIKPEQMQPTVMKVYKIQLTDEEV
jgi:hypothetical protein